MNHFVKKALINLILTIISYYIVVMFMDIFIPVPTFFYVLVPIILVGGVFIFIIMFIGLVIKESNRKEKD